MATAHGTDQPDRARGADPDPPTPPQGGLRRGRPHPAVHDPTARWRGGVAVRWSFGHLSGLSLGLARGRRVLRHRDHPHRLLALDLETTGFDASTAEVISIGTVPIVDGAVRIGELNSTLVRPSVGSAEDGIAAHHLRPSEVAVAPPLHEVLPELLAAIADADALLVHHAPLDVRVLRRACTAMRCSWPNPAIIDTVELIGRCRARERATGTGRRLPRDLAGARAAFGLPPHHAHDAGADAIATAELYLALRARLAR
ncbi:MAG: 3'-5' exonuclease [Nitriliruptor sp.]|nr:MAG: 3'-5' exonuclease [Nitriliruptor sp.]